MLRGEAYAGVCEEEALCRARPGHTARLPHQETQDFSRRNSFPVGCGLYHQMTCFKVENQCGYDIDHSQGILPARRVYSWRVSPVSLGA